MRAPGTPSIVVLSMINRLRNLILPLLCAALVGGCTANRPAEHKTVPPKAPAGDSVALTASADAALKRGDCREASESYAKAAATGDAQLARRATQVAMECEHLPAAWQAASRWRSLAPNDREAHALYAPIALQL